MRTCASPGLAHTRHPQNRSPARCPPRRGRAEIRQQKSAIHERAGSSPMPSIPRRVVTGHDDRGVSVFADDGPVPVVRTAPDGALFCEIWSTDAMPAPIDAASPDPTVGALTVPPTP